jgi:hypothetical protein
MCFNTVQMDSQRALKYLQYLKGELDKYLQDGKASDNEMIQFINELTSFKTQISESDLPKDLKQQVSQLDFKYTVNQIDRSYSYFFLAYLTFGVWAFISRYRKQISRVNALGSIRSDINKIYRNLINV